MKTTDLKDEKAFTWLRNNELAYTIWDKKYRNNGETFDGWISRISHGDQALEQEIRSRRFLFGGRILASRGITGRKVTYSNCYVIAPPEDNIEAIFECATKLARTYSYGGGCGVDISKLAPKGAAIHNAAKHTSGSTSFMQLYSFVTGLIGQEGRRGALMISMDCKHPDLEEFINLKSDTSVCTKANISVRISDEFMRAVEDNRDWKMSFTREESGETIEKTANARDLFKLLAKRNWEMAEPGVLFWDTIQNYNLLDHTDFKYAGVNPCAEEPLPAGGSCLLGSINLAEFVRNGGVDKELLGQTVKIAVKALNDVLMEGIELHPLQEQRRSVADWRQIGLGTMGLADMLIKLGVTYGSDESLKIIDDIYGFIASKAIEESMTEAKETGCFPMCDKQKIIQSNFIQVAGLSDELKEGVLKYGLFNSQLLTCAPTGSIATMLGVSTGVEPIFAMKYTRRTQSLSGKDDFFDVYTPIAEEYLKSHDSLPDYFIESKDIKPINRILVQGVIQRHIDASISSTVNLPETASVDNVFNIYLEAWKHGLKGITVYRANCSREGILTDKIPSCVPTTRAPKRPETLTADYHQLRVHGQQYIVLVGMLNSVPYEIFAFRPNMELNIPEHSGTITKVKKMHYEYTSDYVSISNLVLANDNVEERAATLYTSMLMRHGVGLKYIIKTTKKVNGNISSFCSALCRVLSKYIPSEDTGEKCPDCGGSLVNEGGCKHCASCGYSKCE